MEKYENVSELQLMNVGGGKTQKQINNFGYKAGKAIGKAVKGAATFWGLFK